MSTVKIQLWEDKEQIEVPSGSFSFDFSAKEVLLVCVSQQRTQGYNLAEMQERVEVVSKLKNTFADGVLEISKPQAIFLSDSLAAQRFNFASENIIKLGSDLQAACK